MGTQITWYCPVVNTTTSATRTCSFHSPVHTFRLLMNKNAFPTPRRNRVKSYKYLLANLQLCEALGLELYNIRYYPSFFHSSSFFHMLDIHSEGSGSMYHITSTERSITCIAKSINKAHMATRTVTVVLKNVVQPCRWPFIHTRLIFWTHRTGQKTSSAPSFPIWLASLPRLNIRELASVLTLVSRYTLLVPILTK